MNNINNEFNIFRGVRITKADQEKGEHILVTAGSKNDGIKQRISNGRSQLFKDAITIDMFGLVIYRNYEFFCDDNIIVLKSKEKYNEREMVYIASFIGEQTKGYDYGRQCRLKNIQDIIVPEKHEIPSWVYEIEIPDYSDIIEPKEDKIVELPNLLEWKEFSFDELFIIGKAKGPKAKEAEENIGDIPYITATSENNGIKCLTSIPARHKGNCLTIGHLGDPFYQEKDFSGNNVTYLYSKTNHMNQYVGLFLVSLMQFLPKKYNYGNVVGIAKMKNEKISLPVDSNGNPDWQLMEDYIKSLPYSKYL